MDILNYARKERSWQTQVVAKDRDEALALILDTLCDSAFFEVNQDLSKQGVLQALIERESLRSTAMGSEISFPHARLENLDHALFAIATLKEPVLFGDQPTRIVCLVLVPASDPAISLKLMARFSQVLLKEDLRKLVLDAQTPKELSALFLAEDTSLDSPICARDIMRLPRWSLREDASISECARMMSNYPLRAIPVLDNQEKIVGEVTADLLFQYGLPDFFSRLKSVSFVAEFDPFEKYFADERDTQVSHVMSREVRIVPPEHTIMEIVFDLAIRKCSKLYVVDESGSWIGTVTKGTILDNVINI
jgi:mannitol/fructose-specific phosphotransferase system IIA component (Ntr-type)